MIYKFNNGGIVKLQNAGSVPEYGNIEQIAKYNREHGTNFYKMSQVLEHDKQQAQQKSQNKKKSFWEILAGHPESAGEAILNKTIETANNAELPETRSKIYNDTGKAQLATTAGSLLTLPMLGEFSTYGLLGGSARLAGGFGGSAVGSYALGKAGELGDRTFGTTWMKPAGQVIGGFTGWGPGSSITYKGALNLASKAPNIARIGATDRFIGDVAGRELEKSVNSTSFVPTHVVSEIEGNKVIPFTPIPQKFVSTVHFDPRVKLLSRPISEAERLGIPKNMRSNLKALEDQYYWGYKQWNQRYNAAIESGNLKEAQKLRDLHFKIKAPNTKITGETGMPKEVYHGSQQKFTVFDSSKTRPDYDYGTSTNMFSDNKNVALGYANKDPDKLHSVYLNLQNILEKDFKGNSWNGSVNNTGKFQIVPEYDTIYSSKQEAETALQKILDRYHPNDPVKQEEQRHYMYVKELMDLPHPERSTNAFSDEIAKSSVLDGGIVRNVTDYYNLPIFDENPELYKELTSPHTDYFVKDPRNIKSSAIITRDDFGRIIPIVKRDNFHNPDIRYKQGGILKAQDGTFEDFWNTLPQNQQDSTDFNVRRYWELNGKPGNFKEAIKRGMYKKEKDGYHANSIAFNEETGEYEFMKSPNHPTIKYELDWFNSNDAKKFRDKYQLDSTSIPWKYVPKEKQGGILKAQRGTGLAGLPNVKIPENIKQKLSDWLKYKTIKYDANEPIAYIGTDGLPSGFKSDTPGEIKVPRRREKMIQLISTPAYGQHAKLIENGGKTT